MSTFLLITLGVVSVTGATTNEAAAPAPVSPQFCDPALLSPPPQLSPGFPEATAPADLQAGFQNPPSGYGEVPFWWWTGDPLDKERLLWQIEKLHAMGIPGVQVNYAHDVDMATYPAEPPIFSEAWWDIWTWLAGECRKRDMGIGISGYTIDWPGHDNLFYEIGITDGSLRGAQLEHKQKDAQGGKAFVWTIPENLVTLRAYRLLGEVVQPDTDIDLLAEVHGRRLEWTPPDGQWRVVAVHVQSPERSVDPMNPASGRKVIERFFEPFLEHSPGDIAKGLNYFFQDELTFGVDGWLWNDQFAAEFERRKGYDVRSLLPGLFTDIGPRTPKIRLDYSDVMIRSSEENYFRPIFDWHWQRGMIYACDPGSRGLNPVEFGDYFRCVRWYTAPGHDTPGGSADLRKDKVSSSIAHLYKRPRVWLEGYHSLGWGATPATIFDSSCRNFLYGASLLNLHGLYYTTHGSFWEWAPPCFHFRMPYWEHMAVFFTYFERLSFLLSQGVHVCDVAVMYPVAALEAGMGGEEAKDTSFRIGTEMYMQRGLDFDFMDFESLERAEVKDRQLQVSGEAYRVLVLPAMRAVRHSTLAKALEFYQNGGTVICVGALPEASDRVGREDPELDAMVKTIFGMTAREAQAGAVAVKQQHPAGGVGYVFADAGKSEPVADFITGTIARDFIPGGAVQVLHRHIGEADVYMVMGAPRNMECFFRSQGMVELWDPWTGTSKPLYGFVPVDGGTKVRIPVETSQPLFFVFRPGESRPHVAETDLDEILAVEESDGRVVVSGIAETAGQKTAVVQSGNRSITVRGETAAPAEPIAVDGLWEFELKPTMDNRWGDFRLPATEAVIGAEARRFLYREETEPGGAWQAPDLDEKDWNDRSCSFGTRFWKLGPLPESSNFETLDEQLGALEEVNPSVPVKVGDKEYSWQPYLFSMRWGNEKDPGPQGWHGLKERVTDDFICLGKGDYSHKGYDYEPEEEGVWYYLWTSALSSRETRANLRFGELKPDSLWLNGEAVGDTGRPVSLKEGQNPLLLRYGKPGRTHAMLQYTDVPDKEQEYPLAMSWYANDSIVPYDSKPAEPAPVGWYRFLSPPGLRGMRFWAYGKVQAWADGKSITIQTGEKRFDGATLHTAVVSEPQASGIVMALRVEQERGCYDGAAFPEPIALDCGPGQIAAGDWGAKGALNQYSGGAWYRKTVTLPEYDTDDRVILDLGSVCATAEIHVNGQAAGFLVTAPWKIDISEQVKPGENRLEILVYNTLANHYSTIPTQYGGNTTSGILGPVNIRIVKPALLTE